MQVRAAIRAVGVDIVEVSDVEDALARFGECDAARVYTPRELAASPRAPRGRRLARLFALKEAALKALVPGADPVDWRPIEVEPGADGSARIVLSGSMAALAARRGIVALRGSVGVSRSQALAVVVAAEAA